MDKAAIDRRNRIDHAWAAYEGDFPDSLTSDKNRGEPDFNTPVNKCRPIVNISNSWLFGEPPALRTEESVGAGAQEALDLLWEANQKDALLLDIGKTGKISGHVFVKVIPNGIIYKGKAYPRFVVQDTAAVDVQTDGNDKRVVCCIDIYWTQSGPDNTTETWREHWERIDKRPGIGQAYVVGGPEKWQYTIQRRKDGKLTDALPVSEGDQWENITNPLPWKGDKRPIFDCQNISNTRDFWGTPDLSEDIVATNLELNTVRACINKIIWYYGSPREVGYGFDAKSATFTPGHALVLPNPEAKYEILPSVADIEASRNHAKDLEGDIDEMSGVPGVAIGREDTLKGGDIPAAAMRLRLAPLQSKTNAAQSLYGVLVCGLSSYGLELMGVGKDITVTADWPEDLIPKDDYNEAQALQIDVANGVSQESYMLRRGYKPDEERARKQAEDAVAMAKLAAQQDIMGSSDAPGDTQEDTQDSGSSAQNASTAKSDGAMPMMGNASSKARAGMPAMAGAHAMA